MAQSIVANQAPTPGSQGTRTPRRHGPKPAQWIWLAERGDEPDWRECLAHVEPAIDNLEQAIRQSSNSIRQQLACWLMVMLVARRHPRSGETEHA